MNYYNPFLDDRHKVFLSYYHDDDQYYRELFEDMFSDHYDIMVSKSVQLGDIDDERLSTDRIREIIRDDYLQDSTVTVVFSWCSYMAKKICGLGNRIQYTPNKKQYTFRAFRDFVANLSWLRHEHLQFVHTSPKTL